jgi:CMP-N-acetylneuraminic acid synthetase
MRLLKGVSLIGLAGITLSKLSFIDAKVISTDSPEYGEEGHRYGLDVPFLRPAHLSADEAGAVETVQHALLSSERYYSTRFDIILIIEPTSPLRTPEDIQQTTQRLIDTGGDSVVTVSPLSSKAHPLKILKIENGRLHFFQESGKSLKGRQDLSERFFWRNGVCYALTRACLMEQETIFTENTVPEIITHPVVNIDDPIDLEWAEFLINR